MQTPASILYLDDERDNLIAFKAVFRRFFTVHVADTAAEAFALLESTPIDLVISDQRMPGTTGVEFLEQVYLRYPQVIRMILTGYSDMQAIVDAINRGKIYYYLSKPWKFEDVKLVFDNALETYSLRRRNEQLEAEKLSLSLKAVQLEKEHLASRYAVLKNQINPHFLFNALNTLAALIGSDPQGAVKFATRFAKMYRNVLEHGEKQLISLQAELDMVENYIYLQQIRFGSSLQMHMDIPHRQYSLPPFALQLLVENAIKHNIISRENPLHIHIRQAGDTLRISNPLQERPSRENSTGIGLENLQQRYALLSGRSVGYHHEPGVFCVGIPLIPDA
jgi:sensor histidine kinase YesM